MLQIGLLAVAGVIGTLVRQLPGFALHDPAAYAEQMAEMHRIYDPTTLLGLNIGPGMVELFERLGFFRIFSAPWFIFLLTVLVVSIVVCTLDRMPRLWRSVRHVNVAQPPAFYQLGLDERAAFTAADSGSADELVRTLRGRHFKVRQSEADGVRHVYGDRNQYSKLATLLTHLGLILFLAGGATTMAVGFETVLFLGEGQTAPLRPVGTPDNIMVKNISFEAPQRPDGSFIDFRTDLALYRHGEQVARKTIRVNDPLHFEGYVFHQNTFGPAVVLEIRDADGRLAWDGPVLLAGVLEGRPQGFMTVPGSELGLLLVLDRTADGVAVLAVTGLGATADPEQSNLLFLRGLGLGGISDPAATGGYSINWKQAGSYTGLVIKRDPGEAVIWLAYISLMAGLALTFYFPRRRVWARLDRDRLSIALTADRYVNAAREFDQLVFDLSARLASRPERRPRPA